jgi:CheY-specific phosphatase CheX
VNVRVPGVFLVALRQVFAETGLPLAHVARAKREAGPGRNAQVVASVGVTGAVRGHVTICVDNRSATGLLRGMSAGVALPASPELARAALGEITNQVAGRSVTLLAAAGRHCDITPPIVVAADRIVDLLPGPSEAWIVRGRFGALRLLVARQRRKSS